MTPREPPPREKDPGLGERLLWMAVLWIGGVGALLVVSWLVRLMLAR